MDDGANKTLITATLRKDKIFIEGDLTQKQIKSFKDLGYRSSPKGELYCTYDVYLKSNVKVKESEELSSFIKSLIINPSVDSYLENECPFKLYPFQKEFVKWYSDPLKTRSACLNACEAGLGKTVMTLAAVMANDKNTPLVILCPKNAVGVWESHLKKFNYPLEVKKVFDPGNNCCIITYESLNPSQKEANTKKRPLEDFKKQISKGTVLIADEFHKTKSKKSLITKRFRILFKLITSKLGKCIASTATPLMNRPSELKTLLDNLDLFKISFGNATVFNKLYGGVFDFRFKRMLWDYSKRDPEEIRRRASSVLFIRQKREVLKQLPNIIESVIPVNLKEKWKKELNTLSSAKKLLQNTSSPDFLKYMKLKKALALEKFDALIESVEEYKEIGKPIVVFSCFTDPINALGKRAKWRSITGETSSKDRSLYEKEFNEGLLEGLAISIGAGSTALSLTGGDTTLMLDLSLTPGLNYQARMRTDRISKHQDSLTYVHFVSDHPFEQEMFDLIWVKSGLISDIF